MLFWLAYLLVGAFAGLLAGLLGVGGGIIIVPLLTFLFTAQHLSPAYIHHLALGTSLATIMFTSLASCRAHHERGAVDWKVVRQISIGIVTGTLLGSWVAAQLPTRLMRGIFVTFLFYVALQMLLDVRPKPSRRLPGKTGMFTAGSIIGGLSSLVGIGGGSMSVPFLAWCNMAMHNAIGTSAAIGFPIAFAGTVGYLLNGLAAGPLPPHAIGFIYLPAVLGISIASMLTAPFGARLTHNLPVSRLKKIFACLIIATGAKMLAGLF